MRHPPTRLLPKRRRPGRGTRPALRVAPGALKRLGSQARARPVVRRDLVHDVRGLAVAPVAEEVPRGLVQREDEEAERPQQDGQPADGEDEVAPAHVHAARAFGRSVGGRDRAREVRDEWPRDLQTLSIDVDWIYSTWGYAPG